MDEHTKLHNAFTGTRSFEEIVAAGKTEQEKRAKWIDEQKRDVPPAGAITLLAEAFGMDTAKVEDGAHARLARALGAGR